MARYTQDISNSSSHLLYDYMSMTQKHNITCSAMRNQLEEAHSCQFLSCFEQLNQQLIFASDDVWNIQ
jgi:hypothetical protein